MRTTIAIDESLIDELMRLEPGVSRSEAMRKAIEDYVHRKRIEEFMSLAGSGLADMDWHEAEQQDLAKLERHARKR